MMIQTLWTCSTRRCTLSATSSSCELCPPVVGYPYRQLTSRKDYRNARCAAVKPEVHALMPYIVNFSDKFDPAQLRLVPDQGELCFIYLHPQIADIAIYQSLSLSSS